jgi:outer membrane biosynthesis protein TonB
MHIRVKLLSMILIALLLVAPLALAQEETPDVVGELAQTATALMDARTTTPQAPSVGTTLEPTEEAAVEITEAPTSEAIVEPTTEATVEPVVVAPVEVQPPAADAVVEADGAEARGLPLGVLLIGAVAVLMIGTIVLIRENPRPLDDDE